MRKLKSGFRTVEQYEAQFVPPTLDRKNRRVTVLCPTCNERVRVRAGAGRHNTPGYVKYCDCPNCGFIKVYYHVGGKVEMCHKDLDETTKKTFRQWYKYFSTQGPEARPILEALERLKVKYGIRVRV